MIGWIKLHSALDILIERALHMLEPADREALCGDLAESDVSGLAALRDVMGLVIRRQMASMGDLRPWVLLALLTIPLGTLLSVIFRQAASGSAIYLWLYTANWNVGLAQMPGYWRVMAECLPNVFLPCAVLICSSLATGLLIGTVARQARWLSSGGLIGVLLCAGILGVPHQLQYILAEGRAQDYFGNAIVFTDTFYRSVYPKILLLALSVVPFVFGTRHGIHVSSLPRADRILVTVAFAASTWTIACRSFSWWVFHLWDNWPEYSLSPLSPIAIATIGSTAFLCLAARRSRKAQCCECGT